LALFATLAPAEFVKTLPEFVQYFLGSSIAFGAIAAIILHQILPEPTRDKSVAGTPLQDQGV
jgi:NCS2 family nucleobase:cation symporter-2